VEIVGPKKAFAIEGEDRVGALADYVAGLGDAKINVTASVAITAGAGRYGTILWVKLRDVKRAAARSRGLGCNAGKVSVS